MDGPTLPASVRGSFQELANQVAAGLHGLRRCRPRPEDDLDTVLRKLGYAIQHGEVMGVGFQTVLSGLGSTRTVATLVALRDEFMGTPQAHVLVAGREVVMGYSSELDPLLGADGRARQGLLLQVDMQEYTVIDVLQDQPFPRDLRPYRVTHLNGGDAGLEIEATSLRDAERVLLWPAHSLAVHALEKDVIVWAQNGYAYRVNPDHEAQHATAHWQFDPASDVMPVDVVGLLQREVMAQLLLWVESRLTPTNGLRRPHKAVCLTGVPGNGKTMIVTALHNALAAGLGDRFCARALNAADAADPFHGVTERNWRNLFQFLNDKAHEGKLSLGFVEEIDAAAGDRRSNLSLDGGVEKRVVATLLDQLDGVRKLHRNVLIIFSTNLPKQGIDSALKRRVEVLNVPKLQADDLEELLRKRHEQDPQIFGETRWEAMAPAVREALLTEVGYVRCGKDKVAVQAHDCLSGGKTGAAFDRCVELFEKRHAAGHEHPLVPDNLAREIVNGAATFGRNMTVVEARELFVDAGVIPEDKAREVVEPPFIEWRVSRSPDALHDRQLTDSLLERWSVGEGIRPMEDPSE